ncbi:MAG: hypothetical protein H7123_02690, partial [Thermoleophilia bacterium]|nr:hypothetical protein [Thermoleophilia bacterium]
MSERVRNFWFAPMGAYALAGCRIAVALAMLLNLQRNAGGFSLDTDRYLIYILRGTGSWQPISLFDTFSLPAPSADAVVALFWITLVAGLLLLVGALSRVAAGTALAAFYVLMLTTNSWGKLTHSYEVVTLGLLILACARCGDAWSVDVLVRRWRERRRSARDVSGVAASDTGVDTAVSVDRRPLMSWHYRWPVKLIQLQFALVFF